MTGEPTLEPRKLGRKREWTDERIAQRLRPWVEQLGRLPSDRELRRAGQPALAAAVSRYGGAAVWARRLGVEVRRDRSGAYWSDERIGAALEPFLAGRSSWPTEREFAQAGLSALRRALQRHGGLALWSRRYGLPAPRRGRPRAGGGTIGA